MFNIGIDLFQGCRFVLWQVLTEGNGLFSLWLFWAGKMVVKIFNFLPVVPTGHVCPMIVSGKAFARGQLYVGDNKMKFQAVFVPMLHPKGIVLIAC